MNTLNDGIIWFYRVSACIVTIECIKRLSRIREQKTSNIEWNHFLINASYKTIFVYSKLQVLYMKLKKQLFPVLFIISNTTSKLLHKYHVLQATQKIQQFDFYNMGEFIGSKQINHSYISTIKTDLQNAFTTQYNFIIYSDLTHLSSETQVNKVIYTDIPNYFEYEVSNIKFIALILFYNNKDVIVELSNDEYNYYIVNNMIDKMFIMYFIKNVLTDNSIENVDNFQYKLTLYDHNADIKQLDELDSLVIRKDDYSIVKYDKQITLDGFVIT